MTVSLPSKGVAPATINLSPVLVCAPRWNWPRHLMIASPTAMLFVQVLKGLPGGQDMLGCVVLPDADVLRSSKPHQSHAPSARWWRSSRRLAHASPGREAALRRFAS